MGITAAGVLAVLGRLKHPEVKEDIVSLGLVSVLQADGQGISVELRRHSPNDPFGKSLARTGQRALEEAFPGVPVRMQLAESARPEVKPEEAAGGVGKVKHIVAVASGKGGVGKSTITVNLAVSLARRGLKVGILDADVFGPSMHIMLGVQDRQPNIHMEGGRELMEPVEAYGVRLLSMGFFMSAQDALVWRGPMASNALRQLIELGMWGELDILLIDMPPGTSDIHLTLVEQLALSGAVVVTTPQQVAVADAEKAISMFMQRQVNVPILGVVENMAWFEPEELPGHRYYIFGRGGGQELAKRRGVFYLGGVPIIQGIREGGDMGFPIAAESSSLGNAFDGLAVALLERLRVLQAQQPAAQPLQSGQAGEAK